MMINTKSLFFDMTKFTNFQKVDETKQKDRNRYEEQERECVADTAEI